MIDFGQLVEYVTEAGIFHVDPAQHDLANPHVLGPVEADYAHVSTLGRTYTTDPAALKAALADAYHADVLAAEVVAENPAEVVARLVWVREHPEWGVGAVVSAGQVWLYAGNLYRVIQGHTVTDPGWTPDQTSALWARYYAPSETPEWIQPQGSHDSWPLGAHVLHNGHEWESLIADNVTEPGSDPRWWRQVDVESPTNEWAVGVAYKVGDVVTYQGQQYQCRQAHTSIASWTPPAVLALWLPL